MKASPNGKHLAVATGSGVELYDFEQCSGKVVNPRVIDTTMSFGVCFSPNNQLLYTTRAEYQTGYFESSEIVQWDVSQAQDLQRIRNSEQVLMINSAFYWPDWICPCSAYMGDIAQGKDGKLYILSNTVYDDSLSQTPIPLAPTTIIPWAQTMHIIHQPNNVGMACNPERDGYKLDGYYRNRAGYFLPHPIYTVPNNPLDTIYSLPKDKTMCFGNGLTLSIDSAVSCIQWYNGSASASIFTKDTGRLWVTYARDCQWFVDTFHVVDIPLPQIPPFILTCPYERELIITVPDRNAHPYTYTLTKEDSLIDQETTTGNYILSGLDTGYYTLRIQSDLCDTSVSITIEDMPMPEVSIDPRVTLLPYGDTLTLEAHGATDYAWLPDQYLYGNNDPSVIVFPRKDSRFILVGTNEYGCRDTAYAYVHMDHTMKLWLPNAFSPNGDGFNDVFKLEHITYQRLISWSIFNRYGQQVYASSKIDDGWDGTYQGKPCDMGVYYYHIRYYNTANEVYTHKGEVHLIK
jgi:gliding motility-associated-like protein